MTPEQYISLVLFNKNNIKVNNSEYHQLFQTIYQILFETIDNKEESILENHSNRIFLNTEVEMALDMYTQIANGVVL